jgi:hypothetical protein
VSQINGEWVGGVVRIFSGLYGFLNQIQSPRESHGITMGFATRGFVSCRRPRVVAIVPTVGHESRRRAGRFVAVNDD